MKKQQKQQILKQLEICQHRARTRTLDPAEAIEMAIEIERFLKKAPKGTYVESRHERVASAYKGVPEGTIVLGWKEDTKEDTDDEEIIIRVRRTRHAFDNRSWGVNPPSTHKIAGQDAHPASGATNNLGTTFVVPK
jgi:hypothetical protein